jgi:hypothetical protein
MARIGTTFAALALCLAAACQGPSQGPSQSAASQVDLMTASGFKRAPATTPQQQAWLKQLPPNKISRQTRDGHVAYVYPDPTTCGCLYVGDHSAYTAYKRAMVDRKLADEQTLSSNEMTMNDIDWGPWGPSPLGTW